MPVYDPATNVDALVNENDQLTSQFGGVAHCWLDDEIGVHNGSIAFFGSEFPFGKPGEKPYILRYAGISLAEMAE